MPLLQQRLPSTLLSLPVPVRVSVGVVRFCFFLLLYPLVHLTGIGGDVFCLYYNATDKTVKAINGSGRSPGKLTMEYVRSKGINGRHIPLNGTLLLLSAIVSESIPKQTQNGLGWNEDLNAVTVPGAADGWCTTVEEFGSGKLTMSEILEPFVLLFLYASENVKLIYFLGGDWFIRAIRLAEDGVPVSELHSHAVRQIPLSCLQPNGIDVNVCLMTVAAIRKPH